MTDPNDVLFGGGKPSAKFETPGHTFAGPIVELGASQQTDFKTGVPQTWPDGKPKMQVLVDIKTDERDPSRFGDDGIRRIYVKGKSMTDAVKEAVKATGARGLELGGVLSITYTGDGAAAKGMSAPKQYIAEYTKPDPAAGANAVLGVVDQTASSPATPPSNVASSTPDLTALSPEARAVVEQMLAKQAS